MEASAAMGLKGADRRICGGVEGRIRVNHRVRWKGGEEDAAQQTPNKLSEANEN